MELSRRINCERAIILKIQNPSTIRGFKTRVIPNGLLSETKTDSQFESILVMCFDRRKERKPNLYIFFLLEICQLRQLTNIF